MMDTLSAVFLDHATLDLGDLDMQVLHDSTGHLTLHAGTRPEQVVQHTPRNLLE